MTFAETPPQVTVITVVRNGASILEGTIRSVLGQRYPRVEYVVVDGNSSDGTQDLLRQHADRIAKWISEPDEGISDAFNKAIRMATGDALIFMNAGDHFADGDSIQKLVEGAPSNIDFRASIVYGDAIIVSSRQPKKQLTDHRRLRAGETALCHQSVLIGADVQRRFLYDARLRYMMDLDLWLRCARCGVPFYKVNEPTSQFLAGGLSDAPGSMVPAVIEAGLIRLLNDQRARTVANVGLLFTSALRAEAKRQIRRLLGEGRYLALKQTAQRIRQ